MKLRIAKKIAFATGGRCWSLQQIDHAVTRVCRASRRGSRLLTDRLFDYWSDGDRQRAGFAPREWRPLVIGPWFGTPSGAMEMLVSDDGAGGGWHVRDLPTVHTWFDSNTHTSEDFRLQPPDWVEIEREYRPDNASVACIPLTPPVKP